MSCSQLLKRETLTAPETMPRREGWPGGAAGRQCVGRTGLEAAGVRASAPWKRAPGWEEERARIPLLLA